MPTHTSLKSVSHIGNSLLSDQLEFNVVSFFQWGLLGVGAFCNVSLDEAGQYGGNESRLRLVDDPNYTTGQVWEGFRKDWVWENNIEYATQPVAVSGVYVNGTFHPGTGVGAYAHHVDFPNGRVVFDSPISTSSTVKCEFSYRQYQFSTTDAPWWKEFQEDSLRVEDPHFLQSGSGNYDVLSQNRVQLPAVVVDVDWRTERNGFELGNLKQTVRQDVVFHILGEDKQSVKQMHDIITYQQEKRIKSIDKNLLFAADAYPLDVDGSLKDGALMYPDLVKPTSEGGYGWEQIRFHRMRSVANLKRPPLYYAEVRGTFEVDLA